MQRDFTYIDDIVEGVIRIQSEIPRAEGASNITEGSPLYKIYNIGNNQPVELETFISCIENALDKKAVKNYMPMQDGDVVRTYADVSELENIIKFKPQTDLQLGINEFVKWYKETF
jgi:UDP-glucuronate 4-epimerase